MERSVMLNGIGGQGVQLAARTLGVAAISDGLKAMVFGEYGGVMRGGNTDATVVMGTSKLLTPPTVSRAWAAVVMHHEYWENIKSRLVSGAVVVVDTSVFKGDVGRDDLLVVPVSATETATAMKNSRGASLIALGAMAAATGVVSVESLADAIIEVLPSHRARHARRNVDAIRVGYDLVGAPLVNAWPERTVGVSQ